MKNLISGTGRGKFSLFLFAILLIASSLNAQLPQGFKYQTIVRDNTGLAIANEAVGFRLSILAGSNTGTAVYVETQSVNSSPVGVVSLMVGNGTPVSGTFSQIDWSSGNFYLQIEVEVHGVQTYSLMGTSQLVSVPYALYAQSSGAGQWSGDSKSIFYNGMVGIGGVVSQDTALHDTILFEVKDKNGSPVFTVQESGVHVYVSSGAKGSRGGFTVGGKSTAKGAASPELMMITNDSIRLYVDDTGAKGSKGGFAVGGRAPGGKGAAVNFIHLTPYNSFIGKESGINNATGTENVFLGNQSGYLNSDGEYNIFVGAEAGYSNVSGYNNVFLGNSSGFANDNGYFNVFIGNYSGSSNVEGYSNIYIGDQSGGVNTNGNQNVYVGDYSGAHDTAGTDNVFIGAYTGSFSKDAGYNNIIVGSNAGSVDSAGYDNIFLGAYSGSNSTNAGSENIFLGSYSGSNVNGGTYNNVLGAYAGTNITTGLENNFMGDGTGKYTTTGEGNTFIGDWSGRDNDDGSNNVYLGRNAGLTNISGSGNVFLGYNAGASEGGSNRLYISNDDLDTSHSLIYGEFDNKIVQINGDFILNGNGYGSWSGPSDIRLKKNILNIGSVLDKTLQLRPVNYDWKNPEWAKSQGKQIGLIAQEVEELFPELVKTDSKGMKSIDYSRLSVVLIQAFKEQQQIITKQSSDLNSQESLIQKQESALEQQGRSIIALQEENKLMHSQINELRDLKNELEKIKSVVGKSTVK